MRATARYGMRLGQPGSAEPALAPAGVDTPSVALVVVDAENVRRSRWPNLSREELVDRARAWATARATSC